MEENLYERPCIAYFSCIFYKIHKFLFWRQYNWYSCRVMQKNNLKWERLIEMYLDTQTLTLG